MSIKVVFAPVLDPKQCLAALRTAMQLARHNKGQAKVVYISHNLRAEIMPYAALASSGSDFSALYQDLTKQAMSDENGVRKLYAAELAKSGLNEKETGSASLDVVHGQPSEVINDYGMLADLTIIQKTKHFNKRFESALRSALYDTGRPFLLLPADSKCEGLFSNILIAWNGSKEASHAVSSALPLLREAKKVSILAQQNGERHNIRISPEKLALYLGHHNITANILSQTKKSTCIEDAIFKAAQKIKADLIVMGAYSHTRNQEFLLGGVTESALHETPMPIYLTR